MSYAKPYIPQFILVMLMILIATGLNLAQPKIVQLIIDGPLKGLEDAIPAVEVDERTKQMFVLVGVYLFTVLMNFFISYGQTVLLFRTGQKILREIRESLYDRILTFDMKFFDTHPLGNLVTRVTNDTESLNEMFTSVLSNIFRNIFSFVGIVIMMYSLNARIATFVLLLTPVIVLISVVFRRVIRRVYERQRRVLSRINNHLSEDISGISVIQMFHREKEIYKEFDRENQDYLKETYKEVKYYAMYRPAVEFIRALGIAMLVWFGGQGFLSGALTFGVVYAFVDYTERFYQPILNLAETYNIIQSAMTSTKRIFDLMDEESYILNDPNPIYVDRFEGKIEFQNVWFAYKDEDWVLKDISFVIEPGDFVAFVGATGAGKSSIMNLMSRFYDIQKGQILIDGVDIKKYDIQSLRRAIGIVQQDVFLFTGTIEDNISLSREAVDANAVHKAAELVHASQFIEKLPMRYEEPVMERGSTLSAGQRQLLSFARTVASDPSMLILDEATANIDTETEQLIQSAIHNMAQDRTMIAVAHRISTIADADDIIVLHHGEIAQQGTKDELLEQEGIFRVLYDLQYKEG